MQLYVETSVWGFAFNPTKPAWQLASFDLFQRVQTGRYGLVVSEEIAAELLQGAPADVQGFYYGLLPLAEQRPTTPEIRELAHAYITAGATPANKLVDALHVAHASIARCDALISWDGQHIVRGSRIEKYNQVNVGWGFEAIRILKPDRLLKELP